MNLTSGLNFRGQYLTTNLALISDEHLAFCREHEIFISTSLDGPKELHSANRPRPGGDSYERVVSGIAKARRYLGPDKVAALMTTTTNSLGNVKGIIDEYLKQGFKSIFLRSLSPYGFAVKTRWYQGYDIRNWLQFYFEGLEYILELNRRGISFTEEYASLILTRMFSPTGTGYVDLQSPAGIGISGIVFNYDSDIYASDEARMLAEMGDRTFRLGNLHTDRYEEVMLSEALLNPLEQSLAQSVPMCNDCAFLPFCGSDPTFHYATQQDWVGHKALSSFCEKNMEIMRYLIKRIEDDNEAKQIMLSWVRV